MRRSAALAKTRLAAGRATAPRLAAGVTIFLRVSLSIALSSIASAKTFFSLVFSASSAHSRLASRNIKATKLGVPLVECRAADPVLAAHIGRLRSGFLLPQDPDDLFFRETTWLHVHPPAGDVLYPFLEKVPALRSVRSNGVHNTCNR